MYWMVAAWLVGTASAEEGMWLPEQLPDIADDLEQAGLTLPADALADPLQAPLGAVISLGGCTASFVSPDGLLLTNHHCSDGYLQVNSTADNNLARDGFIAESRDAELSAGPRGRVRVVQAIEDVTDRVLAAVPKRINDTARHERLDRIRKELVAECEAGNEGQRCYVTSLYGGLEYRRFTTLELRDLRLVYAPPSSVGNYGDEIDNWMWPRHSGDFAVLRAYVGPDGQPADYAEDNVPFEPPHHLKVNADGLEQDDFVFVAGFPGSTDRHAPLWRMEQALVERYPQQIEDRQVFVDLLRDLASSDPEAQAKLQAPINGLGNSIKYRQGIVDAINDSDALERKRAADKKLEEWIGAQSKRQRTYGKALEELRTLDDEQHRTWRRDSMVQGIAWTVSLAGVAHTAYRWSKERDKPDLERDVGYQDRDLPNHLARAAALDDTMYLPADRARFAQILVWHAELDSTERVAALETWVAARGGNEAFLDELFDAPALADREAREALFEMSTAEFRASEDPVVAFAIHLEESFYRPQREEAEAVRGARARLQPVYQEALLELYDGRVYPDANGTLRVTYGHVRGSSPKDGMAYLPFTTVAGMAAKAGDWPFDAPERLLAAVDDAPDTRWTHAALGDVPVNFLSTVDTTGGNSGSPTMDADGNLVGLLFDGTYESIVADWVFLPEVTRSIHVDIRYVLWVLETDGATHVIDELLGS